MTMLTRCPTCDTVFRVTAQQLQKQHGQVRCGRCMGVFDGFHTLTSDTDRAAPVAAVASQRNEVPSPPPAAKLPEPEPAPEPTLAAPPSVAPPPAPEPAVANTPLFADEPETAVDEAMPRRRAGWAVASALLACGLIAQAAYVYRVPLAAHYPALKPTLVRACASLRCTVPLPQQPRLITIEASDLQVPDATRPGVIQLTATLRSHAQYDVAYPALDLVLTNAQDHTLARRIFLPREYLEPSRDPALGLPPNAEMTLRIDLDTGDLGASGFRLDLLKAPS